MSNSFVDVKVLYSDNRSLEFLGSLYSDENLLLRTVRDLICNHISEDAINGKKILIKPNWVRHEICEQDKVCLCTHDSIIISLLQVLLQFKPTSILVGDAPIQGCDWSKLLSESFIKRVHNLSNDYNIPIIIKDFRRVIFDPQTNDLKENQHPQDDYIIFDVADKSYLEEISTNKNKFRVTCYNPDKLAETHHKGMHKYCVIKDVFECDTVITVPKIKTHQKSGLTNSLKILVGINGDKDYLPHHRIGAVGHGGDCYKGWHPLRRISELVLDEANRHRGGKIYPYLSFISTVLWRLSSPNPEQNLAAGWYGNDTVWRMVLDLNRIAEFGKKDGTISEKPQRTLYTLCDGIIGGQGNGPLNPVPLPLGILSFSNDAYAMDEVAGILFNLNMDRIPLLKEASRLNKDKKIDYLINNRRCDLYEYKKYATDVIMPPGWINYNK